MAKLIPVGSGLDERAGAARLLEITAEVVAEIRPGAVAGPSITLDSSFDRDLGLDSLSRVELIARIETAFDAALPENVLGAAESPRDLLRAVLAASSRGHRAEAKEIEIGPLEIVETLPHNASTLLDVLEWHAQTHPDRPHIRIHSDEGGGEALGYGSLRNRALVIAAGLQAHDIAPGEAVLIMLPTGVDYFPGFFGVLAAGGIPVPVYPPARLTQIEEHLNRLAGIAGNCGAALMITFDEAKRLGTLLKARAPSIRHVTTPNELRQTGEPGVSAFIPPTVAAGDIAFLQYTSGSTGAPKGVTLTHANLLANIRAMGVALEVTPDDVIVSWLPLYHDMGLIGIWLGGLYHACRIVIMPPLSFLARPSRWLWAIHRYKGTISAAPNFAYEMCLRRISEKDLEGLDLSSWRIAANGAEPVSPETLRRFCEKFAAFGFARSTFMPMFGLAENCVGLTISPLERGPFVDRVIRTPLMGRGRAEPADEGVSGQDAIEFVACGRPIPGHEIRVVDQAGRELPDRREGRLQFTGPSATSGYFRNQEATAAMFDGDWLDTGDKAYIADGELFVTGRIKDIVIRAGRNIYPSEIEDAVGELEGVLKGNVAVFGVRGAQTGTERLVVLAETRRKDAEAQEALRADINGLVTDLIGSPADEVVMAPPNTVTKTSSGKIRRAASREIYEAGLIGKARRAVWQQMARVALAGAVPAIKRAVGRIAEWVYAAWFWFMFAGVLAPVTWPIILVAPSARLRWTIAHKAARLLMRATGLLPVVRGAENLPQDGGGCVVVSNHMSYLDGIMLVAALPRPIAFVAKGELESQFVAGIFLKKIGAVFVQRFDAEKSAADAERIAEVAKSRPVLYFAEGTITRMPGLLPFQMGAFMAAVGTGLPVVPMAFRGTRHVLRDGTWFPRTGRVQITIGEGIQPDTADQNAWKAAISLRDEVREHILRLSGEPDLKIERSPIRERNGDRP
ncbi:MAG: AMP-binding protein [Rhodospirillales bacterium]|nr:AMP-binding protein [Rhodospirillales bacterium]